MLRQRFAPTRSSGSAPRCESACAGCRSAKVEYDYMDFGRRTVDFALVGGFIPVNLDVDQRVSQVKVGLNYRFGGMNPKSAAC
jgi:hypothetical protein